MKKTTKLLALVLAMIMALSVMPFASATELGTPFVCEDGACVDADTDGACDNCGKPVSSTPEQDPPEQEEPPVQDTSISLNPDTLKLWPGQQAMISVIGYGEGENITSHSWSGIDGNGSAAQAQVTGRDTAFNVTYSYTLKNGASGTASCAVTPKVPAGDLSITGANSAKVNEYVQLTAHEGNDATLTWSVSPSGASASNGGFRATKGGTYTVKCTAVSGIGDSKTTKEAEHVIVVADAEYAVSLVGGTFRLNSTDAAMKLSVTKTSDNSAVTSGYTVAYASSKPAVATVADDGKLTLKSTGTTEITATVTIGGQSYLGYANVTVTDQGMISCDQDRTETTGSSVDMTFVLDGAGDNDNVTWSISVSSGFDCSVTDSTGGTAAATIRADDIGVATVSVSADWAGQKANATFHISFYQNNNFTVTLKDGLSGFDFDDKGAFKEINGKTNGASTTTLYNMFTDGAGDKIRLSEDSNSNSRVGKITLSGGGTNTQYSPDKNNDYTMQTLADLNFEVKGSGKYRLNFTVYSTAGGAGLATSKGTCTIITGETDADITYNCPIGGKVTVSEKQFEEFWEENFDDSDDEDLKYVTFAVSSSTAMEGSLLYDGEAIRSSWKFYADFDDDKHDYDLAELVYQAAKSKQNYEDVVAFTCYGEDGSKLTGDVCFEVGTDDMNFSDVKTTDWFYDEVAYVYSAGIMNGTSDTTFSPAATLTRGMVVTMIYRLESEPNISVAGTFSDVAAGQWYAEAVEWAAAENIVNGMGNGKFAPDAPITREQLATILYRYTVEYKNETAATSGTLSGFGDAAKVSAYAEAAMQWAVGSRIITGDAGNLKPLGSATRAEAAAMFARFMQ